jgi:hypothetical protein
MLQLMSEEEDIEYMQRLVIQDWHNSQEDFAFGLGIVKDPSGVPYLIKAATMIV